MRSIAVVLALASAASPARSAPDPMTGALASGASRGEPLTEAPPTPYELAEAGETWRLSTRRGPVRVWIPNGYDPATAIAVIYIHGYYAGVDRAWREHRLPEQFAASHLNAMFIACGAPEDPREPVTWPSLRRLLQAVARGVPAALPAGRLVAVGHSAAHRTLEPWLGEPALDTIALVDAAYSELGRYRRWLRRAPHRRLISVGAETRWRMDRFHRGLPGSRVVEGFPPARAGTLPPDVRDARILYIRASRDHMDLVTDGVALPMLLRALRAPLVRDQPRSAPLSPLPPASGDSEGDCRDGCDG